MSQEEPTLKTPKTTHKRLKTKKSIALRRSTKDALKKPKTRKWKRGTVAKREVIRAMRGVELMVPKKNMDTLTRQSIHQYNPDLRIQDVALRMMHHASEDLLIDCFAETRQLLVLSKTKTITPLGFKFGAKYVWDEDRASSK
jgi:histone H3/H4